MTQIRDSRSATPGAQSPGSPWPQQGLIEASLDCLDQGLAVFDAQQQLQVWNERFFRMLDLPTTLARPGTAYQEFVRHDALRNGLAPSEAEQRSVDRSTQARNGKPDAFERMRPGGRLISIRRHPLNGGGFAVVCTDQTGRRDVVARVARHQAELDSQLRALLDTPTQNDEKLSNTIASNQEIARALLRSERLLRDIIDSIPAAIAYVDRDWVYRYANKIYAKWFGWTPDAVKGRKIRDIIGQEVFEQIEGHIARAMSGERVTYEYTITGRENYPLCARTTLVPDIATNGELLGAYVHSMDITEQRRTQAALAQAQKMEAIGQLTGGLAHDFNNILTVVIGNLLALKESHPDAALSEHFVEPAMQAANRGAELIRRLLGFARRQSLEPMPVEVNELILGMSKLIRRSMPSTIAVRTSSHDPWLIALVDAHQLENALLNLALNARDAMPNGGELTITSSLEQVDASSAEDLEIPPGDYVQIAIRDNGVGMDRSTLSRVFEPFFTTKPFGQGSGLGMAMVYGFIKQSGGGIRIRSRQACGTSVELLLPRAEMPEGEHPAPDGPGTHAVGLSGKLVLLAEDDADVRQVVRMQLAELGCVVVEAENGAEAADMVENIPEIELVLSDVVMPGAMNGHALARFVRRFRPDLPIVLMSGFSGSTAYRDEDGSLPVLVKPFSRDKLLEALLSLRA